ncbi:type II toxin-antitoxin system VapC family toxin [Rhizobium sp. CB3090]|uniref:type II toxin-antitoxin system VapC family toxin n=1 Tax=Rhizobium sp. CB3090 TaxID=3039156 RepID=UPI0024B06EA8|nr:type II toxin-antitoxin system VapC family toxin [Rhizobium sp. CB3090]WFU07594.1 type II toxin-antitoxin system VapC family toxin [Rhizobium sp. CB3090]
MNESFLLDTCAAIWLANGKPISQIVVDAVNEIAPGSDRLCVSALTAWEIGMLISRGRIHSTKHALAWFEDFVKASGIHVQTATPAVMIAASYLPEPLHSNPMDRIIIATAREHDLTIITRDRAILAYGAAGHVKTLAC